MDDSMAKDVRELTDEELKAATGGSISVKKNGHLYIFSGGEADMNRAFGCPKCWSALQYTKSGSIELFHCPKCGVNYSADAANPNFGSGLWIKFF